ncbi:hypothetical protein C1J03_19570 [Sulfitobacter sp. SK012]|uniref:hypothetical protein n=1 Tax=Sulfitobacter sp. SK012 TaxID=1389005 RepID=UPI000E0BFF5B|nr:hypothetical protein [Sulfitobacter sp. SK012]AXI48004.1 hypothetical protein C1J03_19570 [Sulfitobacter sp. SK012]
MKTVIFDTALALRGGTPRHRQSEALRAYVAARAQTLHVTIDIYASQDGARRRMARADKLVSLRPTPRGQRPFLTLPNAPLSTPATVGEAADHAGSWLSPARLRRLRKLLIHHAPDLIVVGDPMLAPLLPAFAAVGCPTVLIGNAAAAWHARAATSLNDVVQTNWHADLATLKADGSMCFATSLAPCPLAFDSDDLFFEKTRSLVMLSTGYDWLDAQGINTLCMACKTHAARGGAPFDVVLIGFGAAHVARVPEAVSFDTWAHLAGQVGSARALYLPHLTPELASVAEAALGLGTPVIASPIDVNSVWPVGALGVIGTTPETLPAIFAGVMDDDMVGDTFWRGIAAEALKYARTEVSLPGLAAKPVHTTTLGNRPRRHSALSTEPMVLYNPLSHMVLAQLSLHRDAGVDEVRLKDSTGTELIRLMPSTLQREADPVQFEGGVVATKAELGAELTLEFHDFEGLVETHSISTADFIDQETELSWIARDGVTIKGGFWTTHSKTEQGWALGSGASQSRLSGIKEYPLAEIGGTAVAFSTYLDPVPGAPMSILNRTGRSIGGSFETEQRPLFGPEAFFNTQGAPRPGVEMLKDKHKGQRAWIVGNGPSVRLDDLGRIPAGDVTFCFNRFYLSYADQALREDYVVSADTLMIEDFGQEMIDDAAGMPIFCLPRGEGKDLNGSFVSLRNVGNHLPLFSMDPSSYVSLGGSSVFVALQMAHYMGIRDVALYGMDYSFSMQLRRDPRFPFPVSFDDGNHFIKSYRSAKPWCPPTWRDISAGFLNARVAFETTGGKIVNASRGGKLTTFARADFDDLTE